jgi:hypothetical protein
MISVGIGVEEKGLIWADFEEGAKKSGKIRYGLSLA